MPGSLEPSGSNGEPQGAGRADLVRYGHLGIQFAITIGALTAAGVWADGRLGTMPLFTLLGVMLGFGTGFYHLYKTVVGLGRDMDRGAAGKPGDRTP